MGLLCDVLPVIHYRHRRYHDQEEGSYLSAVVSIGCGDFFSKPVGRRYSVNVGRLWLLVQSVQDR